jgi:hypothetical protein
MSTYCFRVLFGNFHQYGTPSYLYGLPVISSETGRIVISAILDLKVLGRVQLLQHAHAVIGRLTSDVSWSRQEGSQLVLDDNIFTFHFLFSRLYTKIYFQDSLPTFLKQTPYLFPDLQSSRHPSLPSLSCIRGCNVR